MEDDNQLYNLSRRKVLGGLGAVGLASAGAGLGTSAYFTDTESLNNNTLTAGELDLVVDWVTGVDQGSATPAQPTASGTIDGNPSNYSYEVSDVKPGDSGVLAFCPKIVDNPAWLWFGSDGVTDYENEQSEPEAEVDATAGAEEGELSESIIVSVAYADSVAIEDGEVVCTNEAVLNYPADFTLADLAAELESGFLLDADRSTQEVDAYPASPDAETQTGPCICVHWELPTTVGNEVQTDSLTMDFDLVAVQERHNPNGNASGANPFNTTTTSN
ncbi:SipW-dependent-type signal peptide-containing protein [Salarchaeum japonicum]|uniref:SipW-dependent-type signal peptide-containing protein n=1 Tax=Salarchaeum japonicum TaxID=555573 RepID=UPI003C743499